ncbi:hypothetical protein L486_08541 [Kwoniella mangroviensis CBS 10435]|uniref:Fe2OG dioxygenase domain-containing protein n=1 Tax=Kwoniella mangroviensis CBS 10435 TaxID=1331196 RepID=A0A1B9IEH9_9TREE|nr:hypothetical protein L486_08541 [Kwoniella mangroviensis CBS 10435]
MSEIHSTFQPPSSDGKPLVPDWLAPPATKEVHDFAKLTTIDLSLLDSSDPSVVADLVATTKRAIKEDGFLYLVNYGVTIEQLHRQFAIAQYLHRNISEEDKERLLWDPATGLFAGYKPGFGWKREKGAVDGIEHFNFYHEQLSDINNIPTCIHPFRDEIIAFCEFLTQSVNRRLLRLLSKVLELDDDFLWNKVQSQKGPVGEGYLRHALFHPLQEDTKKLGGGLRMNGHHDYGTTTLLFSVPISCLQIYGNDEKWRYVGYNPGSLVVNLGETLEIISGGHFKATRHRVYQPPSDQAHEQRLSLVLFNAAEGSLRVSPAMESPLLQREGCINDQGVYNGFKTLIDHGMPVPTMREWREIQIATLPEPNLKKEMKILEVNGKLMYQRDLFGIPVVIPV